MADGRLEVFRRALLGRDFFAHVAPLRSRPGVASIIWESLVSIGGRSREHFADNRSAHYLFIYIDIGLPWSAACWFLFLALLQLVHISSILYCVKIPNYICLYLCIFASWIYITYICYAQTSNLRKAAIRVHGHTIYIVNSLNCLCSETAF